MTRPTRYLVRIVVFLLIIMGLAFALRDVLVHAFMVNPGLDGVIIAILLLGILWNLHLTIRLFPEVRWVNILRQPRAGLKVPEPPRLLSPMARVLRARRDENPGLSLSTQTTRAMLESLEARMDEGREISRYITQLLVFLGLLGTFYGLILTVRSVADVISAMPSGGADISTMFEHVKTGLVKPLGGMSTAFSASMFGLAGSLILGFLDLTSGQAQNRFANEIEEWLADQTFLENPETGPDSPAEDRLATMEAWLPRVQDFMRLTTENVALLQQNITILRRILEVDGEDNAKIILGLRALNETMHKLYADGAFHKDQSAILGQLTSMNETFRKGALATQHDTSSPSRENQGSLIERLTRISENLLHHREAAAQPHDKVLREGQAAIIEKLVEIREALPHERETTSHQHDEAIRAGQTHIIEKLTEINETLRSHQAPPAAPAQDLSQLQQILQQIEEGNQATLRTMKALSSSVSQRHFEDPAVTQLLQDMERQLLGLRTDIVSLARSEKIPFISRRGEG